MSRENFDFGAEVAVAVGKVYRNPVPGPHDSIITAIVHVGNYMDVFVDGPKKEAKPPCNFILIQTTLMSEDDKNEDGSRIQKWQAMPLKHGNKSNLTAFLMAVDPTEKKAGFGEVIGTAVTTTWKANERKGKNEDGTWKAVNLNGYTGMSDRTAKLVLSDAEAEGLTFLGHIKFDDITLAVLEEIPGYLIRQYLLSEKEGNNLSYAGSSVEAIINAKRAEDSTWKTAQEADEDSAEQPGNEPANGTAKASDVPDATPAPAVVETDLQDDKEF